MSGDQVGNNGKQFADYPMVGFTRGPGDAHHQPVRLLERAVRRRVRRTCRSSRSRKAPALRLLGAGRARSRCSAGSETEDPDGSRAFTIVPTVSFGGAPTTQFMTSLDFNGSTGKLILWRLKVVDGVLQLTRARRAPGARWTIPRFGRQCGNPRASTTNWDTGDLRLTSSFWDGRSDALYTTTAIRRQRRWRRRRIRDPLVGGRPGSAPRRLRCDADGQRRRRRSRRRVALDRDRRRREDLGQLRAGGSGRVPGCLRGRDPAGRDRVRTRCSSEAGFGRYEYAPGLERWGDFTAISRDPVTPTAMATYGAYPYRRRRGRNPRPTLATGDRHLDGRRDSRRASSPPVSFSVHAGIEAVRAHAPGGSGRGRRSVAPAAAARRVHPQGRRAGSTPRCRSGSAR